MHKVRKGYVVFYNSNRYTEGKEIPSVILPQVLKDQIWKLEEVSDGKQKGKEEEKGTKEKPAETTNSGGEERKIVDEEEEDINKLINNRMVKKEKITKK